MTVDMKKMKRGYQQQQRGGEFLTLDAGETLLYIHPQCRPDDKWEPTDGVNYVPFVVHYGLGKHKGMIASLNPELNPIIEHPFIKRYLKKRKIHLTGVCPAKEFLESGDLDGDELDEARANTRYLWGVTPIATRSDSSDEWRNLTPKPSVLFVGKTLYDGIMEVFFDNGDITDPNAAIFVIVGRVGKDKNTKYKVRVDPESLKKPRKLSKELRAQITKAIAEDGDCDLFKIVSNIIKSPAEVEALISGVKTSDDGDDDDDEDDEDAKPKKSKPAEDDDEDDGEEALEDDDDEPPAKTKVKDKPAEDDDEDDEPAEDDDEDDEPPPPKAKPKAKPAEDDDLGLDEIDAELERIANKPKKAAKK
jgi:hypothetical protein